jgi:hypothetical protein
VTAVVVLVAGVVLAGVGAAAPTLLPAAVGPASIDPAPAVPPCLPSVRACVDLATDRAWLLDNGRVVRGPVPIRQGAADNPTPRGSFTVQWKAPIWTSREFLVQMPWSVFFADGGIAFHAGNPATFSAGCVKLGEEDARAFFNFLQVGDPVQVV